MRKIFEDLPTEGNALKSVTVNELAEVKRQMFKLVQEQEFRNELQSLKSENFAELEYQQHKNVSRKRPLEKIDPFIDEYGIITVGGSIRRSNLESDVKHPVILPKHQNISFLIGKYIH